MAPLRNGKERRGQGKNRPLKTWLSVTRPAFPRGSRRVSRGGPFDLCADGGIGGLKRKFRPRSGAPTDADSRDQSEGAANHSQKIDHCDPVRHSATLSAKIERLCKQSGEINRVCPFYPAEILTRENIKRTIGHGQAGLPSQLSIRDRQNRLPGLLATWLLSSRSIGREIRARDQPSRPHGPFFLRLPLAGRGAVKEGQVRLWRLSAGP
jgi:hypothetical protein